MNTQNYLIILDVHGLIDENKSDSIRRHLKYESEMSRLSKGNLQMLVLSKLNKNTKPIDTPQSKSHLNIIKFSNIKYIIKSVGIVRKSGSGSVIVCGDPWVSYYTGYLIKLLSRKKIPIQVQIHADIYDRAYARSSFRNQVKVKTAFFSFWSADSIRTVSKLQSKNMIGIHPKFKTKIVKASVPLNSEYLVNKISSPTNSYINVGILGRIESDRGFDRLLELSEVIVKTHEKIRFICAGSGSFVIQEPVSNRAEETRSIFTLLGELDSQELPNFFNQIDVLLSLAPSESFGRALRESLISGRPVVAVRSSGVNELEEYVGGECVFPVEHDISNPNLIRTLLHASRKSVPQGVAKLIEKEQNESIEALAQSWVNLSNIGNRGISSDS